MFSPVAGLLARFPYAAAYVYNPALLVVGAAALCLGVGVLCFRRRLRWLSAAMLAAFVAAAFVGRFNLSGAQVRVLDVGQGQAILLEVDGFTAVIDCGGEAPEAAGEDMARLLHSAGITPNRRAGAHPLRRRSCRRRGFSSSIV